MYLVYSHCEVVDVRSRRRSVSGELLWGHPSRRSSLNATGFALGKRRLLLNVGDSKICDAGSSIVIDQDVCLEIIRQ